MRKGLVVIQEFVGKEKILQEKEKVFTYSDEGYSEQDFELLSEKSAGTGKLKFLQTMMKLHNKKFSKGCRVIVVNEPEYRLHVYNNFPQGNEGFVMKLEVTELGVEYLDLINKGIVKIK